MRRALLLAAALAALALPGAAFAHANIKGKTPRYRERLKVPPKAVVIGFDQRVTALPGSIEVLSSGGKLVSAPARTDPDDSRVVEAPLPRLPKGAYTVRWHVLSKDGHVISGVYTFGVRASAPPPTEAVGASGPTTAEHVVRWGYFLALSLVLGGLGFRLLVLRGPIPPALERRFYWIAGIGTVAVLEVGIVAFLLRAEDALQLPFGRFLYADLTAIESGTRVGSAFVAMTIGFVAVISFLFLSWLTDRRVLLWPAFLLALGFASGLSLSGHQAGEPNSFWGSQLADWIHVSAATLWVGGLVQLVLAVWPTAPELRREAFVRFSRLATALIALILGAGVYLSVLRLPHVSDLWSTGYGQVLLVKLSLVALALLWGAFHHFVARPLLERPRAGPRAGRLARSLAGESAVGMAILLAAAVLVDSKPPPQPAPQPAQAAVVRR